MELKPGYKKTDVGLIPEEWNCIRLGDIGEALIGLTYRPADVKESGILVLRSSNIQNNKISLQDNVFVVAEVPERIRVRYGDVLVCVRNGSRDLIGKSTYLDERVVGMTFGAFMAVHRSPYGRFISFLFQSRVLKHQISEHLGATINQITNKSLNSFQIPLPGSDDEQCAIATALGDVDALLAAQDALIAKKRAIKQGAMQELLTGQRRLPGFSGEWEVKRLGDFGQTYGGLVGKSKNDFGQGSAQYVPFVNVISNVVVDLNALDKVDVSPDESQNRVLKGDLLFNGSSETPQEVALCALVVDEVYGLYLNSFCFGFRLKDSARVSSLFLTYYMRGQIGRDLIKSLAQGSTRYNLSKSAFLDGELKLPSAKEQTAIAEVLSDMDAELAALEAQRAKTAQLKQGMMQSLLTGRIRLV